RDRPEPTPRDARLPAGRRASPCGVPRRTGLESQPPRAPRAPRAQDHPLDTPGRDRSALDLAARLGRDDRPGLRPQIEIGPSFGLPGCVARLGVMTFRLHARAMVIHTRSCMCARTGMFCFDTLLTQWHTAPRVIGMNRNASPESPHDPDQPLL